MPKDGTRKACARDFMNEVSYSGWGWAWLQRTDRGPEGARPVLQDKGGRGNSFRYQNGSSSKRDISIFESNHCRKGQNTLPHPLFTTGEKISHRRGPKRSYQQKKSSDRQSAILGGKCLNR